MADRLSRRQLLQAFLLALLARFAWPVAGVRGQENVQSFAQWGDTHPPFAALDDSFDRLS
jgi:hypothetical protein